MILNIFFNHVSTYHLPIKKLNYLNDIVENSQKSFKWERFRSCQLAVVLVLSLHTHRGFALLPVSFHKESEIHSFNSDSKLKFLKTWVEKGVYIS